MNFPQLYVKHEQSSRRLLLLIFGLLLVVTNVTAQSGPVSSIDPIVVAGNPNCATLNASSNPAFSHITTDYELKLDSESPTGTFPFTNGPNRILVGPGDPSKTVTIESSKTTLEWASTMGITAVIVKGGPNANVYPYATTSFGDTGLTTVNGDFGISHVTFCYAAPAQVRIVKVASTVDGSGTAVTQFGFTASAGFGTTAFSLIDNVPGPGGGTQNSQSIWNFGTSNAITVQENVINGWTLADINCVETGTGNSTWDLGTRSANIVVEQGETVTCTFTNSQLTVTAAQASISGRVIQENGAGIRGAVLTLMNITTGEIRSTRTNSFGLYAFNDLEVQNFYVLTVEYRKTLFHNDMRSFTLYEDLADVDFVQIQ